ncbi:TNF receptor-associated factor 4-like [Tubulanus polymorphus]|uniref:TNF receptor-associated factor 4-like n=1 Tax=Tubulanus polymorphus TaxID=672921 RepID=UPI003DA22CE4
MPGYSDIFVDVLKRELFCLLCQLPMRDPVQITSCGHRFCDTCLQEYLSEGVFKCPEDQLPLDYAKIYPDPTSEDDIVSAMVRCPQHSDGCRWTDLLSNLQKHLEKCRYYVIRCPNDCSEIVTRMCLQDHIVNSCKKRREMCEYCGQEFKGDKFEAHLGTCSYEVTWCENKCGAKLQRRFLGNHMRNECHKRLAICRYCGKEFVYETLQTHQYSCPRFPVSCPNRCDLSKIPRDDIELHIKEKCPATIIPCPFVEHGCSYKAPRFNMEKHVDESSKTHLSLVCTTVHRQQQQINNLKSKVHTIANVTDGIFIWKLPDYKLRLAEARSKPGLEIVSEPFYTSRYGYKLVTSLFMNGNGAGEGKYVSLYIKLVPGEYDNILEWPFCLPMSFTLLDQNPLSERVNIRESFIPDPTWKHFRKPDKEESSLGFGYPKFVSHETLKTRKYLLDDCLFLRIKVDPRGSIQL